MLETFGRKIMWMVDFLDFVSCQLVAKFILLTAGFRLSWWKTEKKKTETRLRQMGNFYWKHGSSNNCHDCSKLGVNCLCGKKLFNLTSFARLLNLFCCFKSVSVLAIWGKPRPFLLFLVITHPCRNHFCNDLNHFSSITLLSLYLIRFLGAIV